MENWLLVCTIMSCDRRKEKIGTEFDRERSITALHCTTEYNEVQCWNIAPKCWLQKMLLVFQVRSGSPLLMKSSGLICLEAP